MKAIKRIISSLLLLSLGSYSVYALATTNPTLTKPLLNRLILHDFNVPTIKALEGRVESWSSAVTDSAKKTNFILSANEKRGADGNSLYISYSLEERSLAKAGIRTHLNKLDASDFDHVEFWIKGDPREGYADSLKVEFQRPLDGSPELIEKGSYVINGIGDEWKKITISLSLMNGITKWTDLSGFSIEFHPRRAEIKQGAYFIDDIALIKTGYSGARINDEVIPLKKKAWEAELGGQEAAKQHIWARLVDWPARLLVEKSELPKDNQAFLMRLAHDTWRGLNAFTDNEHGLPLDTVSFGNNSVAPEKSRIGDYTNITNIGMYLISVVAATDFGFITRNEALSKLNKTLITLEKLETHQGFFYNYYDTTTLERTSNFISFVDSTWLTAGLMVVRVAFPELHKRSSRIIEQFNYSWLYDDVEQLMSHGYYVNLQYPSEYHYGLLYTESRMGSLIAIGKGDVPEEHWYRMVRTFPEDYSWQSLVPKARKVKSIGDREIVGGYYEWSGLKYIPSWGGSLFEALMPTLVVDEAKYAPDSLGINNRIHAEIHRRYALEELRYPVWGMSPSSVVAEDNYSEFGVKILGSKGYDGGVVTPHASVLALNVTPDAAIANMRKLVELYEVYGEYGFFDAVDPISAKVARKYLALDQAMIFISLANYLRDNIVRRYFAADPIAGSVLPIMGAERFFE